MDKGPEVKPTASYIVPSKTKARRVEAVDDEDPWDKVNQNTIQQFQQNAEKRRQMTLQSALGYFEEFAFDPQDIDDA